MNRLWAVGACIHAMLSAYCITELARGGTNEVSTGRLIAGLAMGAFFMACFLYGIRESK